MKILGRELIWRRNRKPPVVTKAGPTLQSVNDRGWLRIYDRWPGAWQQDAAPIDTDTVLAYHAIFACITLLSNDFGKCRARIIRKGARGIWAEIWDQVNSRLLRRPNSYQNHIQFKEWWAISKLSRGNTYALKVRNGKGQVVALYILDPCRVKPMVTPNAEVYYSIGQDNMADVEIETLVPASEIIHDRMNCLFHPLVGIAPIWACGHAASAGLSITQNSERFFANNSLPGGILTAPGTISEETATRLKAHWDDNYSGSNAGKVAVLGDNLKFEAMRMSATDSQLIEQLKWTQEVVCSVFHVPPFKIGLGQMPTYQNAEVLNQIYYSDGLQSLIEQFETCMDEGLGLEGGEDEQQLGVELDLSGLWRMDSATQAKTLAEAVKGSLLTPNEARAEMNKPPLPGGDTVYMQQQNFSLEALSERDANDPFAKPVPTPTPDAAPALPPPDGDATELAAAVLVDALITEWRRAPLRATADA